MLAVASGMCSSSGSGVYEIAYRRDEVRSTVHTYSPVVGSCWGNGCTRQKITDTQTGAMQRVELRWGRCNGDTEEREREMTDPCDDGFGLRDQCNCWGSGHMGERVCS